MADDDSDTPARRKRRAEPGVAPDPSPKRVRRAKAEPWNIGSLLPWSVAATVGDPVLLLGPLVATVAGIAAVLALGAGSGAECSLTPACPAHVLVPLWSLPPFDAYQDAGAIALITTRAPFVWLLRALALGARAAFFGAMVHLALQRAADRSPEPRAAAAAVRARIGGLTLLELASFAVFGIPILLGQGSLLAAGRPVAQLGGLIGLTLMVNAFFAAFTEPSAAKAFGAGLRWVRRRPLGHVALCVAATAASNGVYWLATTGEVRPRDLTLGLYSLLHATVTTVFLVALARRWMLLYAPDAAGKAPRRHSKG